VPESLICAGCGLLCDDVTTDGVRLEPECALGDAWLADRWAAGSDAADAGAAPLAPDGPDAPPAATIAGASADREIAIARAAALLRDARRPLVHGFAAATIEDARAAVALADRLGAIVATGSLAPPWPGAPAFPLRGSSTATLGEIRDRSQLVIVWHEDPETTHPRLLQRLGFGEDGAPTRVDGPRTLVVVDDRDTATARRADLAVDWPLDRDVEALAELFERFDGVRHATIIYGATLATGAGGQRRELALHELVRRLSHGRHVVALSLPSTAGVRGADDVLAWQTGYAGTVDLASGHPELLTVTEPLIEHQRIDLALCVEDDPGDGVPTIVLSHRAVPDAAEVWIRTAPAGVAAAGTMHRLDGVPLTLQPPSSSAAPSAATVLADLLKATDI
jgi:formylmethanofuran dehydrogenase subunit B